MRTLAPLLLCGLCPLLAWADTPSLCIQRDSSAATNACARELRQLVDDQLEARHNQLLSRETTQQRMRHQKQFKAWLETRTRRCAARTQAIRDTPLGEAHFQDCLREASEQHLRKLNEEAAASCTLRNAAPPLDGARCGKPPLDPTKTLGF
ncbi:hypothetical protein TUM18999_57130 [Pseudomonas tohonis]|uniref:Lysozyme inhibitor LprI N-terminal domain-containing protein n=1 Tax=Pseudomonas tohonis TaxID=2725477 RepID=A0A6J4ECS0_9PSED|nr:lysozyme inhibitor LprI family protein [Pseudomonas tohonis]BCG27522.1 hypothetical protein TUM18999_57130 [Pseudomonas tohonis]GJN53027.1 hypothetical protein TUM20286_27790 [Pseudomonas tohonis]